MSTGIDIVYVSERLRGTLSPLRQRVLTELREPASATMLAERLGESRQRINYHLRELEKGGLVELVEERQRRGRMERIMRAVASAVIVAPELIGDTGPTAQDRFAADTLLAATARTFTDVARLRDTGIASGEDVLTFTVEVDIGFDHLDDVAMFTDRLAGLVAQLADEFDTPTALHRYHLLMGGHPAASARTEQPV